MNAERSAVASALAGTVVLAIGLYLPWVRTASNLPGDGAPDILLPQMNAGFEFVGLALLAPLAVVLPLLWVERTRRAGSALAALVGIGAVALPIHYVLSRSLVGIDGPFVPTWGWGLTMIGGLLLVGGAIASART